jgi:tRNA (guanine-N7-)-methyltransferase
MMPGTGFVPWRLVFGDEKPVEVEIGPGLGEVLLAFAARAPGVNFFGIERGPGMADAIQARAAVRHLRNVRVVGGDARCILATCTPDASVAAFHIYFPDPWPKTRHRHRRLASETFAATLARTLAPGGAVHVATDLPAVLDGFAYHLGRAGLRRTEGVPRARPATAFERRYAGGGTHYTRFDR